MNEKIYEEIRNEVSKIMGREDIVIKETVKDNSVTSHGISTTCSGNGLTPVVYMDKEVDDVSKNKMTVGEAARYFSDVLSKHLNDATTLDVKEELTKEKILSGVVFKVVSKEQNNELLKNVPHEKLLNLAIVYCARVYRDGDNLGTFTVSNEIMEMKGIEEQELRKAAAENTANDGYMVSRLSDIVRGMTGIAEDEMEDDSDIPILVLSNANKTFGAAALCVQAILEETSRICGGDFYILPSSVHELLTLPVREEYKVDELKEMVTQVNESEVLPEDFLSENVYIYRSETGRIEIAA